jgi:zinc transport system substrate-binding protein
MKLVFMWKYVRLLLATTLLAGTAACGDTAAGDDGGRLDVVAAFYPLQFVTEQVGGDAVRVRNPVPAGAEPHDLELGPRQVAAIIDADLVVYLRGFQPAVDDALRSRDRGVDLDAATVQPLRDGYVPLEEGAFAQDAKGTDPHVWLDPTRLAGIADAVAATLGRVEPARAASFRANAAALRTRLDALDASYRAGLRTCALRTFVVSHNAFGYLAERYRMVQVAVTGLTPEEEPTPARLAEVARLVRERGVRVVFFETLVSPRIARTLAREVGARAEVLDPVEGLAADDGDYVSVMRTNLTALRTALRCT